MNLMNDALSMLKVADAPLYKSPKSLQEAIEIKNVYPDGIFELPNGKYSKSYMFSDINYVTADEEEQEDIFSKYCSFLNSMNVCYKITLNNKNKDMDKMKRDILLQNRADGLDAYRHGLNEIMESKIKEGRQGIEQERYLTVTVDRKSVLEAKAFFNTLEVNLKKEFGELGAELSVLDGNERLHILYDFYHLGREYAYEVNFGTDTVNGLEVSADPEAPFEDFRNDLCNGYLKFNLDNFRDETKCCRALFIKRYPNSLSDRFLNEIMSIPVHLIASIDVVPVPKDISIKALQKKYLGIENDILKQQRIRNKNSDFSSGISYKKRMEKAEIEEIMNDVGDNDKSLFFVGVTFIVMGKDMEEVNSICDTIETIAKRNSLVIDRHYLMQREALNSALPIGVRQVETLRVLLTDSLAVLMPFNVQELTEKQGIYYGTNQVSKNLCVGNRKKLVNGNGFVFGVPGSGKSFFCKMEMLDVTLGTEDDVIIIDPQNEYFDIARKLNGEVVNYSNASENHINPMDVELEKLDPRDRNGIIRDKGEFMLGLCEQCIGNTLNAKEKSIIDRCVREMYLNLAKKPPEERTIPTMSDFYSIMQKQPEEEARNIALAMEIFINGSLNIFNNHTNVDTDNRFLVYGIRDMGKELAPIAMLVMMENISRRIQVNSERGRSTWLYIDEFHVLLDKEYSAKYLFGLWKKVRKQGGLCTGITQNVLDLMQNYTAVTMLANSEFVVLLRQSAADSEKLSEMMGISKAHLKFVTGTGSGVGLLKHGDTVVPIDVSVDKKSEIYRMFSTNPNEK